MIPYGKQSINQQDIDAVIEVLQSEFVTQGPKVPEFEEKICAYTHSKYAVATNSATSALHIACLSLDLGVNDYLWTSPITFVASANCAIYCGAKVDFVDIDPETYNLCAHSLEIKLKQAKKDDKLPKIVVAVHLSGHCCDMKAINALSKTYGFAVIEDASHAIGGQYYGEAIGSCQYSDITVFSFHPVKIITTAEGGMATTNDPALIQKMQLFRSHGITRDPSMMVTPIDGPWQYQQICLGFNYRMTDIQAALGISQMQRLDNFVTKRQQLAKKYIELLEDLPVSPQKQLDTNYSSYHLFIIRLQLGNTRLAHKETFEYLRDNGIGVNLHYIPVHTQPYYKELGFKNGDFPQAEAYYQTAISLPLFPELTSEEQHKVVNVLREAIT